MTHTSISTGTFAGSVLPPPSPCGMWPLRPSITPTQRALLRSVFQSRLAPLWLHIHVSSLPGGPSGVKADPAPPQPGCPVCPSPKLAASAGEAHLRVLRVRGQRKWLLACGGGEDKEALGSGCCVWSCHTSSPSLGDLSLPSQGCWLLAGPWHRFGFAFNISLSSKQYLGSMLIKDLRGTESTQDACAKMRVRRPRGQGGFAHSLWWVMWRGEWGALSEAAVPQTLRAARAEQGPRPCKRLFLCRW